MSIISKEFEENCSINNEELIREGILNEETSKIVYRDDTTEGKDVTTATTKSGSNDDEFNLLVKRVSFMNTENHRLRLKLQESNLKGEISNLKWENKLLQGSYERAQQKNIELEKEKAEIKAKYDLIQSEVDELRIKSKRRPSWFGKKEKKKTM